MPDPLTEGERVLNPSILVRIQVWQPTKQEYTESMDSYFAEFESTWERDEFYFGFQSHNETYRHQVESIVEDDLPEMRSHFFDRGAFSHRTYHNVGTTILECEDCDELAVHRIVYNGCCDDCDFAYDFCQGCYEDWML